MEITITLKHGSLKAEFAGNDQKELESNLLEFIDFIHENEGQLNRLGEISTDNTAKLSSESRGIQQTSSEDTNEDRPTDTPSSYGSIPSRTGIEKSTLRRYFDIDQDNEEPPYLNFESSVLGESGDSRAEKQMRGSLILLTLWNECNETEKVRSPDLKDALRISGIDDTNLYNMYQFNGEEGDRYFQRNGRGGNARISLTMAGKREGFDQIRRTVEQIEDQDEEEA